MSSETPTPTTGKTPTAAELYRIAAFAAAMMFAWTSYSAYGPPTIVIPLLVIVGTAALAQKTNLAPIVYLTAFFLMEVFSHKSRSTPTQFVIVGSMLGVMIFNARIRATQEPIRAQARPRRGWWGMLTTPIKQLFGRGKAALQPSPPGNM